MVKYGTVHGEIQSIYALGFHDLVDGKHVPLLTKNILLLTKWREPKHTINQITVTKTSFWLIRFMVYH